MQKATQVDPASPPFAWWVWMIGGAVYGVLLRALFGQFPAALGGTMSVAFLLGTPFAVGALTIYGLRERSLSWVTMLFAPWLTVVCMLGGCALTLLEGAICIAILSPLFLVVASVGGLCMGIALRLRGPRKSQVQAVALLPFLLIAMDHSMPLGEQRREIRQSMHIQASAQQVWGQILTARAIKAEELPFSWTHWIGVPRPVEGVNVMTDAGEVRFSKWDKGVNFKAIVTQRKAYESIAWRYVFDAHSFPAAAMDEHVEIGGRYFDLQDTRFNLYALADGSTDLEIVAHYRVTSSINFYAVPAAEFLGRDFVHAILSLYKGRSERAALLSHGGSVL